MFYKTLSGLKGKFQLAFFGEQPFQIRLSAPSPPSRSLCWTRDILLGVSGRIRSISRWPLRSWCCRCRCVGCYWSLYTLCSRYLWVLWHVAVRVCPSVTSYAGLVCTCGICVGAWRLWVAIRVGAVRIGSWRSSRLPSRRRRWGIRSIRHGRSQHRATTYLIEPRLGVRTTNLNLCNCLLTHNLL